jgi:hypothetical protein
MRTNVILHSALPPSAVADALRRSIDEERRTLFSLSGYKGDRPVLGEVKENAFRLQKRTSWRNDWLFQLDFAPHFYGQFRPEAGGTRVEGYFALSRWVTYFGVCLAGVGLFGGGIFGLSFRNLTTGGEATSGLAWVGLVYASILILFGILLPQIGRIIGRSDERFILEHLQHALVARVEEADAIRTHPMP